MEDRAKVREEIVDLQNPSRAEDATDATDVITASAPKEPQQPASDRSIETLQDILELALAKGASCFKERTEAACLQTLGHLLFHALHLPSHSFVMLLLLYRSPS